MTIVLAFVYVIYTQIKATACMSRFAITYCMQHDSLHFVWIPLDIGVLAYKTNAKWKGASLLQKTCELLYVNRPVSVGL